MTSWNRRKSYTRYLSKLNVNLNEGHRFFTCIHLKSPVYGRTINGPKQHTYHCYELADILIKTEENSKHTTSHHQSGLLAKVDSLDEYRIVFATESQQDQSNFSLPVSLKDIILCHPFSKATA